jgi:hypothetical protein
MKISNLDKISINLNNKELKKIINIKNYLYLIFGFITYKLL